MRNIWRLYGGWYDGDPSHLKPAPPARARRRAGRARRWRRDSSRTRARELASRRRPPPRRSPRRARRAGRTATTRACTRCAPRCSARAPREEASTMSKGIFSWAAARVAGEGADEDRGLEDPRHRCVVRHRRRARAAARRAGRDRRHRRPARASGSRDVLDAVPRARARLADVDRRPRRSRNAPSRSRWRRGTPSAAWTAS